MTRQPWEYQEETPQLAALLERGLAFLDAHMPAVIRAPGDDAAAANDAAKESLRYGKTLEHQRRREQRVGRVVRAYAEWGWSTAEIAQYESLSRRRVQELLAIHCMVLGNGAAVASGPAA